MGNDTRTMTLTDFLLQRIAEDEAVARVASPGPWDTGHDFERVEGPDGWVADGWATDVRHLVRWQPARVLAECEAKRRIVEQVSDTDWGGFAVRDVVLELLALPYADHPEFREEWRV